MRFPKDYRRVGIAVAIIAVCVMMSPIPTNADMTMGNRYFNWDNSAIRNNSFIDGLDHWTVKTGIVTTSASVYYDEDAAIDFATGLDNDIMIEQELTDASSIIEFAGGKDLLFSFKFKTDYSYSTARASIGTKSYDRNGVLRWYWTSSSPLLGKVSGDGAGSWVTIQHACWICPDAVYGLAVRIEIIDSYYSAVSSSIDDGGAIPQYVIDPGDGGGHVNPGYVDDAQLAVSQTISTFVSDGLKMSLVVIVRSVEQYSRDGDYIVDHAVVDIAFAADTNGCTTNAYDDFRWFINLVVIEVHLHPAPWIFGYYSKQDGRVNVIELDQTNDLGIDVKPCDDAASATGAQIAGMALGVIAGVLLAPLTGGTSIIVGLVVKGAISGGMSVLRQAAAGSDMNAVGPGRNYYTRTRLVPSQGVDQMTIINSIDWYYAHGHADYNLQIYGAVDYRFPIDASTSGYRNGHITTYLYA